MSKGKIVHKLGGSIIGNPNILNDVLKNIIDLFKRNKKCFSSFCT